MTNPVVVMAEALEKSLPSKPTLVDRVVGFAETLESRLGAVTSSKSAELLTSEIEQIRELRSECEEEKKAITTPLTRMVRAWGRKWKPAIDALDRVERAAKAAVLTYQQSEEKRTRLALQGAVTHDDILDVINDVTPRPMGTAQRWTFHVMHPDRLPSKYRVVDQRALDAYAREHKDDTSIPGGVAICTETAVMRRSK